MTKDDILTTLSSIEFGVKVAREYVSAYGPVSLAGIRHDLSEQTNLTTRDMLTVITVCLHHHWQGYDGLPAVWNNWTHDEAKTLGLKCRCALCLQRAT